MAGYTRQSTADIIPTATVRAAPINAEYNAIRDAFAASGGHKHDGTTGEGEYVPLIADLDALNKIVVDTNNNRFGVFVEVSATAVEQVRFQDGAIVPVLDNDIDLGTSSVEFKNLYLDGTANIDSLVADTADINGGTLDNVTIGGTTPAAADFTTMDASGNATIGGTLGVTSNTTLGGTLGVTGATTLSSTLGVTGNTTLSGTLGVTGATTLSSTLAVSGSATLSSTLSVSSNTTVGGNLAVTGTTSSTGDFSVNTNKFTVAASSGNTAVAGTLGVTGATTVGGTLGVTGATTLSSTAAITGNTTIGGTLGVTGTTSYSTLTGSNLTATGTINFSGATVSNLGTVSTAAIGGGTINNTVIGGSTPAAITGTTVTATSFVGPVTGNITGDVTGDLTGNVTAASGASTFNNVTINGTLDVTNTTIENVSDPTTAQQAATKAYVDSEITNLIGGAPGALDTLNELAAAINDDANVYTTLTTSIATKLPKAGGTMTGAIAMGDNKITGLATPTAAADATTKAYVDQIETDAEAQATAAAASAAAAAASYDAFDDRYLGSKASDPTLDNDGNALLTGALYFDSTNSVMKVYNGTEWANASSSIEGVKSNFYYTATSGQTVFSGADDNANTLVVDQVDLVNVYMNGVRLHEDDYTVSAASDSVTLAVGAATDDLIYLEVFGNFTGQSGAEVAITGGSITGLSDFSAAQGAFTGDVTFGDNDKAIFGAGSDLQIYHDGTRSYIDENGTGDLWLRAENLFLRDMANKNYLKGTSDAQVELFYNGIIKLATTSTGVDITGTLTSDGLTVEQNVGSKITLKSTDIAIVGGETIGDIEFYSSDASGIGAASRANITVEAADAAGRGHMYFKTSTGGEAPLNRMLIAGSGDISFYEDTGTTAKFFWDASAESLGIGTSSPSSNLHVLGSTADVFRIERDASNDWRFQLTSGALAIRDATVDAERLRIDSSGNLLLAGNTLLGRNTTDGSDNGYLAVVAGSNESDGRGAITRLYGNEHATNAGRLALSSGNVAGAYMDFRVAGSEAMRIDSSGNVGIGATSPARGLHVNNDGESFIRITSSDTGNAGIEFGDQSDGVQGAIFQNSTDNSLRFNGYNNAERMRIDSSGNVGIGTSSPGVKFVVANGADADISTQIFGADTTSEYLGFGQNGSNSVITAGSADIQSVNLVFRTASSGSETEAMRIDSSGNLLVGTTNVAPAGNNVEGVAIGAGGYIQASYDGYAPMSLNRQTSDGDIAIFKKDGATVGSIGTVNGDILIRTGNTGIRFVDGSEDIRPVSSTGSNLDATLDLGVSGASFKDLYLSGGLRGDTTFKNNAGTTEYARFDSSGNLLVGTTSAPNGTSAYGSGFVGETNSRSVLRLATSSTAQLSVARFYNPNGQVGEIKTESTSTLYVTSSDHRLKENVVELTGATNRLKQLEPKRFNFIADADTTVDGFLAHEVQSVVPEAITGTHNEVDADGNPVYQGIDQSKLVPLLVATIKELEARITALENG